MIKKVRSRGLNIKDVRVREDILYFLPVETRIPLKFGPEVTTHVSCARVKIVVETRDGRNAEGWGETPLSVAWAWPSELSYKVRNLILEEFCRRLVSAWRDFGIYGHPIEIGYSFLTERLPILLDEFNREREDQEPMPWLAALICNSPFDIALHDAYGMVHLVPTYATYNKNFMNHDLSWYYTAEYGELFTGHYPEDYYISPVPQALPAWHLVGGKDFLNKSELTGGEPMDGYPVLLSDWIRKDGLKCLKVKLTGTDEAWDYERLVSVGRIAISQDVVWLSADFNCTVTDPEYVNTILDRLMVEYPRILAMILYVEQPFPYDLEVNQIDVHSVSARKPLFMDESAHEWKNLALGMKLGWTGVALKTCKTQTGALLSMAWAKAHGMTIMVQDLTNPMLAQIPHLLLAAHVGTIMGVESNAMQFYPEASSMEARIHPGMYVRKNGMVHLDALGPAGFGYQVKEIGRILPAPQNQ